MQNTQLTICILVSCDQKLIKLKYIQATRKEQIE